MLRTLRQLSGLAMAAVLLSACENPAGRELTGPDDDVDDETLTALSWVGQYDGSGVIATDADTTTHSEITMTIALDAAAVRDPMCHACVTVRLEPWFSVVNARLPLAADAFLSYAVDSVLHTMSIQRFSGAGGTANALLVAVQHEDQRAQGDAVVLRGDFELRVR